MDGIEQAVAEPQADVSLVPETSPRTLVFTATYNERDNIPVLLEHIRALKLDLDILILDDNSPDGTWALVTELQKSDPRLHLVHRPGKLGLGTAHQLAIVYAMQHGYDRLVTMDADMSHDPADIPRLLERLKTCDFVIGSRYAAGGASDYEGYRKYISTLGNTGARFLLGLPLQEYTTSYRAFDVNKLRAAGGLTMRSSGYSFFLETVFRLHLAGFRMAEVPIKFRDRHAGVSKIPRLEVLNGMRKLLALTWERLFPPHRRRYKLVEGETCAFCGGEYMAERIAKEVSTLTGVEAYRCSSMGHKSKPRVVQCLSCSLVQVPASEQVADLEQLYSDVEDPQYVENRDVRDLTFRYSFRRITPFLPKPGTMLEIGAYCGYFMKIAQEHGWRCHGVEPSRWAAQQAESQLGITVFPGTLAECAAQLDPTYDVVVTWDVLEHVRDPLGFLKEAGEKLAPGGILCFSTLDIDNWFPRLLEKRWPWLMDMHLFYFTKGTLRLMLDAAGFELVHDEPYRHYASVRYIFRKMRAILPSFLSPLLGVIERIVPRTLVIPISFGDVRAFVARKR